MRGVHYAPTMKRILVCISAVGLFACGGAELAGNSTTPKPAPTPQAAAAPSTPELDFSGWRSLTKISKTPFASKGHKGAMVAVYVTAAAAEQYRKLQGTYAEGTQVVKTHLKSGKVQKLLVMQKMPAGYDPDNGDWFYGVYSPDGKKQMAGGKLKMCVSCHDAQGSDTDYVIGVPKSHQ